MNPSYAAAFLPCSYCKSASVLAINTALALLTSSIISAFIAHWYIHSGPNAAIAGGGASAVAAASLIITHLLIIQRNCLLGISLFQWSSGHVSWSLGAFLGAVWCSNAAAALRSSPGNRPGTGVSILAIR
jgi:hypothetical protein